MREKTLFVKEIVREIVRDGCLSEKVRFLKLRFKQIGPYKLYDKNLFSKLHANPLRV